MQYELEFPVTFEEGQTIPEAKMEGLGFLVWQISAMPEIPVYEAIIREYGIKWVSWKVAQSKYPYNQVGGNDKKLLEYRDATIRAGATFGGWHYMMPTYPGPQGDLAEERREKLGLDHYLLDIESEYETMDYGVWANLRTTIDKLHNGSFDIYECSFKFPTLHAAIPHGRILAHGRIDGTAPQVYWERAHNVQEQLTRSLKEYRALTTKPFVPIGCTYWASYPDGVYWEPTTRDFEDFVLWCVYNNISTYGFYSLDWIVAHNKWDWMEAIAGVVVPPPPPPPASKKLVVANCDWLNARSEPSVATDNRLMTLRKGVELEDLNQDSGNWKKVRITTEAYVYRDYVEGVE